MEKNKIMEKYIGIIKLGTNDQLIDLYNELSDYTGRNAKIYYNRYINENCKHDLYVLVNDGLGTDVVQMVKGISRQTSCGLYKPEDRYVNSNFTTNNDLDGMAMDSTDDGDKLLVAIAKMMDEVHGTDPDEAKRIVIGFMNEVMAGMED